MHSTIRWFQCFATACVGLPGRRFWMEFSEEIEHVALLTELKNRKHAIYNNISVKRVF